MAEELDFPAEYALQLEPHLPPRKHAQPTPHLPAEPLARADQLPFVTLTFATSLDSALSLAPGTRTTLSGPQSKAMTHFLRSRHDAICVGVGTAMADDPGLNCRLGTSLRPGGHQPRPIVIDPQARWNFSDESKVLRLASEGYGMAPFIVTSRRDPPREKAELLARHGGKYIFVGSKTGTDDAAEGGRANMSWKDVLGAVKREGLESIMIEGGGQVINSLLGEKGTELIDSVIVTIAPTWLGQGGVVVSPARRHDKDGNPVAAVRLAGVSWHPLGEDVVLCGKILRSQ